MSQTATMAAAADDTESRPSALMSMPPEIHREIFDHLEDVPAVILSLTCKQLRETYQKQFLGKKVKLIEPLDLLCRHCDELARYRLHEFLASWIPDNIKYDKKKKLYVSKFWSKRAMLKLGKLSDRVVANGKGKLGMA